MFEVLCMTWCRLEFSLCTLHGNRQPVTRMYVCSMQDQQVLFLFVVYVWEAIKYEMVIDMKGMERYLLSTPAAFAVSTHTILPPRRGRKRLIQVEEVCSYLVGF